MTLLYGAGMPRFFITLVLSVAITSGSNMLKFYVYTTVNKG